MTDFDRTAPAPAAGGKTGEALTVREIVTFAHPFTLAALGEPHPPGTFELIRVREALDVSWPAYRERLTLMLRDGGTTQAVPIEAAELQDALARDAAVTPKDVWVAW